MNKENTLRVADAIENAELASQDIGFNMGCYFATSTTRIVDQTGHGCTAVGCIAGWTCLLLSDFDRRRNDWEYVAAKLLDLTEDEADALFTPTKNTGAPFDIPEWDAVTATMAVTTLRRLAETGEVKWDPL